MTASDSSNTAMDQLTQDSAHGPSSPCPEGESVISGDHSGSNREDRNSASLEAQKGPQTAQGLNDGMNRVNGDSESSEKDPFEVTWDSGHNDPLCPLGFNKARKWLIVFVVSFCGFTVTCASSIYTSTYAQMESELGNSRIISILGLSMFVLGLAFGPMFFSPLSEFYGRRPIYLVAWTMFIIWIIPSAVAQNIQTMVVARFLDGFSGSAFLAVSGGTVSDLFSRHEIHAPMALFSVAPFLGPEIGPVLGGFINFNTHWRWTYYTLLIWSVTLGVAMFLLVPETYHSAILKRKAQNIRKVTGDNRWYAPTEKSDKTLVTAIGYSLLRPCQLLIFEPMCLNLCLYSAILLGILYLFFGAFPLIFSNVYGFNLWQIGLSFLGIAVGLLVGIATNPIWHRIHLRLQKQQGVNEPEFHLPSAVAGGVLVPIGLFWFAWTIFSSVHWIVPIIGSAIFGMGYILLFTGIFTFLVDAYPKYAASALAANTFVRCVFAAAFPLFGNQMYERLNYHWATSLLAFLNLAMMPFPYIFFKYGKRIRDNSRFASG